MGSHSFHGLDVVAFSGLEDFRLSIAAYGHRRTSLSFPKMDDLRLLLGSLRHLRFLDLDLPLYVLIEELEDEDKATFYSASQVFLQEGHWCQLTSLSLSGLASSAAYLLTLFTRRTPNLTILGLSMIDLVSDSWEGVIECMSQSMHLSNFHIAPGAQFWHREGILFFWRQKLSQPFCDQRICGERRSSSLSGIRRA